MIAVVLVLAISAAVSERAAFEAATFPEMADDRAQAVVPDPPETPFQRNDPDFDTRVARPAYLKIHPRVRFDEAHHNFHTARGRYKPFVDLITGDGYRVVSNLDKFTRTSLSTADILVIANALGAEGLRAPGSEKPAFTDDECDAVQDWVSEGGNLLLITDIPSTGSAALRLSLRFRVEMTQGVALDPNHSQDHPSKLVFSRENRLLGEHSITRGRGKSERVGRVMSFAGQALRGPQQSVSFLTLSETAIDPGGAGEKPFSIAGLSQGLALRFGMGRVVVLGEAGLLSAQILGPNRTPMGMNVPGIDNRQLALNIMHWLSSLIDSERD